MQALTPIRSAGPLRRSVATRASGAPSPLNAKRRGKLATSVTPGPPDTSSSSTSTSYSAGPSSSSSSTPSLPRLSSPIDAIADQIPDPILRAAVKEPVAFWGGVFAGVFKLNLDQDPLRSWVERTAEQARSASGQGPRY
ncbi:hypothetical protein HYH03_007078 [Edaphochlamys debaryana]|uniref:Uncharacterized protein n=1 Tax=Edaphochlamys debaryana TaxID=47281 RepID=A0A835Y2Q9_9CHLO|nr:hypothetical protein HYH03_007078 [Edaphochlamys debaryana]|eukprot:KAG2494838.1 hypothetical protein HYH03_007078 [Edaphochlamys debaryana]